MMIKNLILSLMMLSLVFHAYPQEIGVKFQKSSWKDARAKAKLENKHIFVDVFATWCGPCKNMDADVYPARMAGDFMNEKFIAIKLQADKTKDDSPETIARYPDADEITNRYRVIGYPALLFFSPEGELVNKSTGFVDAKGLVDLAKVSLKNSKTYRDRFESFSSGKLNGAQLLELTTFVRSLGNLETAQMIAEQYMDKYLFNLNEDTLFTKDNLEFIGKYLGDTTSKSFKLFSQHSERINSVLGPYQAQKKIMDFIDKNYLPQQNSWTTTKPNWDILEKKITATFGDLGSEVVLGQRMISHVVLRDNWDEFARDYVKYFEKALDHSSYNLNTLSWYVFEQINDPKALKMAVEVMKYDIENYDQNDPFAWDTYANLLHKVGRTGEAVQWEEKVVKGVKGISDEKVYMETLEKMKAGKATW